MSYLPQRHNTQFNDLNILRMRQSFVDRANYARNLTNTVSHWYQHFHDTLKLPIPPLHQFMPKSVDLSGAYARISGIGTLESAVRHRERDIY